MDVGGGQKKRLRQNNILNIYLQNNEENTKLEITICKKEKK